MIDTLSLQAPPGMRKKGYPERDRIIPHGKKEEFRVTGRII
jgi:hypothetical protein